METAIRVIDLSFTYHDGTTGLKQISFEIKAGQTVLIMGANGTGKSTLLLNLMGILRGTGEIEIFGVSMNKRNLNEDQVQLGRQ